MLILLCQSIATHHKELNARTLWVEAALRVLYHLGHSTRLICEPLKNSSLYEATHKVPFNTLASPGGTKQQILQVNLPIASCEFEERSNMSTRDVVEIVLIRTFGTQFPLLLEIFLELLALKSAVQVKQ